MDYGMVSAGSAALWGGIAAAPIGWSPHVTFYVQTGDIAATIARASEFGGRTLQSPMRLPSGSTIALIQDPEGHTIGLTQPAS